MVATISDGRLSELAGRIRPVVRFAEGRTGLFMSEEGWLYFIEPVDPRRQAFTWDPTPTEKAPPMETLTEIMTYHEYGAPSFFKPSVAEVLVCIPNRYIDLVTAFETVDPYLDGEHHVATTRLYREIR